MMKRTKRRMLRLLSTSGSLPSWPTRNCPISGTRKKNELAWKPAQSRANELTMKSTEFERRRRQLMRMVGAGGIAILPAAPVRNRSRDVEYRYRQDSDFLYLTGFPEPEAVAVLVPGRPQGEYLLFCRERNAEMETWHGRRAGLEGACTDFGADDAFPITDLDDILPGLLENTERVYATMGHDPAFDRHLLDWVNRVRDKARAGITAPVEFIDLDHLLHEMRLIKSPAEIK